MATEFGERLKLARKRAGLNQNELADKAGTKQTTVSSSEKKGLSSPFTPLYAQALGVSALWLAEGIGEMEVVQTRDMPVYKPQKQTDFAASLAALFDSVLPDDLIERSKVYGECVRIIKAHGK